MAEVEQLLLNIRASVDINSFNLAKQQIGSIYGLLNKTIKMQNKLFANINKVNKINIQDKDKKDDDYKRKSFTKTFWNGGKSFLKNLSKVWALTVGGMALNLNNVNKKTAQLVDELNWQHTNSKTAFALMNTAAASNMITESEVSKELVEILKNQREKQNIGIASNTQLEVVLSRFGASLTEPIEDILQKLVNSSQNFDATKFYTLLQSGGLSNIGRSIIERNKNGDVPEIYNQKTSQTIHNFVGELNRTLFNDFKKFQIVLAKLSIPLLRITSNIFSKILNIITPLLEKGFEVAKNIANSINNLLDKSFNSLGEFFNELATILKPYFIKAINEIQKAIEKDTILHGMFEKIGSAIVSGIIEGITASSVFLVDKITNSITDLITNSKIGRFLGFKNQEEEEAIKRLKQPMPKLATNYDNVMRYNNINSSNVNNYSTINNYNRPDLNLILQRKKIQNNIDNNIANSGMHFE